MLWLLYGLCLSQLHQQGNQNIYARVKNNPTILQGNHGLAGPFNCCIGSSTVGLRTTSSLVHLKLSHESDGLLIPNNAQCNVPRLHPSKGLVTRLQGMYNYVIRITNKDYQEWLSNKPVSLVFICSTLLLKLIHCFQLTPCRGIMTSTQSLLAYSLCPCSK